MGSPSARSENRHPSVSSMIGLDGLTFCITDIANGLGAFTATYLQADRHWDPAKVGAAISAAGIAAVIVQTPAGALIDYVRQKRKIIILGCLAVAVCALAITLTKSFAATVAYEAVIGAVTTFLPPAIAAISLGLVGHAGLDRRVGRNQAFSHGGNVMAAALAGWLGFAVSQAWVFYLIAILNLLTVGFVLMIRKDEIDFDISRGGDGKNEETGDRSFGAVWHARVGDFTEAFKDSRTLIFVLALFLFHFANAGVLPLVGQHFGLSSTKQSALYMGAAIIIAQLVMIPTCWACGKWVKRFGRKPLFLIAFACVPIRAALCAVDGNPVYLVAIQSLDGISAGVFYVLSVLVVADLTRGTKRFNAIQGFAATCWSLGAALSPYIAGVIAKSHFKTAFLFLAVVGVGATVFFWIFMPETRKEEGEEGEKGKEGKEGKKPEGQAA